MGNFRRLLTEEIEQLKRQMCSATDWNTVEVSESFSPEYVWYTRFSGKVRLGTFSKTFALAGGMQKH